MAKDIINKNQLNITIIAFPILILFAALILALPSVFAQQEYPEYDPFLQKDYDWSEFYDDEIDRDDVELACDASEDYEANEKACDKAYDLIEKQEKSTVENCEAGGGKWVVNGYAETCIVAEEGEPIILEDWMSNSANKVSDEEPVIEDWANEVVEEEEESED